MKNIYKQLYETHYEFFKEFFKDKKQLETFIREKLEYTQNNIPRRMINNTQRLCTLSDEMDRIRPGRRDLSIFFILTCIESLFKLSNISMQKQKMIIDFYENYISREDKEMIESNIEILNINRKPKFLTNVTIEQFALLLCSIRNNVAHEGVYWSFHFKAESENNSQVINILNSKLKKDQGYDEITYEVGLKYSEFREITIKGLINFCNQYFTKHCCDIED